MAIFGAGAAIWVVGRRRAAAPTGAAVQVPAGSGDLPGLASGGYTSGVALPPQKSGLRNGNGLRGLQSPTPEEE